VSERSDRADTKRVLTTLGSVVAVIVAVIVGGGLLLNATAVPAQHVPTTTPPVAVTPAPAAAQQPARADTTTTPAPSPMPANQTPAAQSAVICIDAGHQAHGDSSLEPIGPGASVRKPKVADGATGVATHKPESQVNLEIAMKLRDELRQRGFTVVMVRETQDVNISNSARAAVANNAHAALFIRLHCDGTNGHSTHGLSTLVPSNNQWTAAILAPSTRAAQIVHRTTIAATGAADRGVVTRGDLSGFNWSTVPTILIEMGFLSNPDEDRMLNTEDYQWRLAKGMADGVAQYVGSR
jgi:N-acetylmuramoyl-L-alanine amidase